MLKFIGVPDPEKDCIWVVELIGVGFVGLWGFFVVFIESDKERCDSMLIVFM